MLSKTNYLDCENKHSEIIGCFPKLSLVAQISGQIKNVFN